MEEQPNSSCDPYEKEENNEIRPFSFVDELPSFYESNRFKDVKIRLGRNEFSCHRTVLSAVSPFFREIFQSVPDDFVQDIIVGGLDDESSSSSSSAIGLNMFLQFIYSGTASYKGQSCSPGLESFAELLALFKLEDIHGRAMDEIDLNRFLVLEPEKDEDSIIIEGNKRILILGGERNDETSDKVSCSTCKAVFGSRSTLTSHVNRVHKKLRCEKCQEIISDGPHECNFRFSLDILNDESEVFSCPECEFKDSKRQTVLNHYLRQHNNTSLSAKNCNVCLKEFRTKEDLKNHDCNHEDKVEEEEEDEKSCTICHRTFTTRQALSYHLLRHTGEKPFKCKVCLATFRTPSTLSGHFKVHHESSGNKCEFCGLQTSTKGKLKAHLLTHTGEQPYECNVCFRRFRQKSTLTVHQFKHTGVSRYQCKECEKYFPTLNRLNIHSCQNYTTTLIQL